MIKWGEFSKKVFLLLYLRTNEYFLFFNLVTVTIFSHKSKSFTLNINHCTAINNVAQWFSTSSSSCYHYCLHVHLKALQQQNQLNFITFLFFSKRKVKNNRKKGKLWCHNGVTNTGAILKEIKFNVKVFYDGEGEFPCNFIKNISFEVVHYH